MSRVVLLLPEWKRCVASVSLANGTLARWWGRGNRQPSAGSRFEDSLQHLFQWPGNTLSVAALSRQHDAGDAEGSAWLRADPAHVRADMATARMLACGALGLSASECASIARDLGPLFGDAGFEFDARRTDRWYLRAARDSKLPDCASPDEAIGDDLKLHLPEGAAGKRWRQLFNDAQIILHNHPVNTARAARGAVSVNSLWFWGAGSLPGFVRSTLAGVRSDRPEMRAMAALAGIPSQPLGAGYPVEADAQDSADSAVLFDLVEQRDIALQEHWLVPVEAALGGGRVQEVALRFASGQRVLIRRAHRWRFWRRVTGLAQ